MFKTCNQSTMTLHFQEYLGPALTLKNQNLAIKVMAEDQEAKEALPQQQQDTAAAATAAWAQLGHKKICRVILEDFQCNNHLGQKKHRPKQWKISLKGKAT